MPAIIKANTPVVEHAAVGAVAFNFDDVTRKANAYLEQVKAEAAQILAKANQDAAIIRKQAQEQGQKAAIDTAEKNVHARVDNQIRQQLQTALPAVNQLVQAMAGERLQWLEKWEQNAVQLSVAIAQKIIRRELVKRPEITLALIREALELASGSQMLKVYMNPQDHAALGKQAAELAKQLAHHTPTEILPHEGVTVGGCVVQSEFGTIDQQIESQLARITEELF
jgi:flagellar assembly protein FliH